MAKAKQGVAAAAQVSEDNANARAVIYEGGARLNRWLDGDSCELTLRVPILVCQSVVERTHILRLSGVNAPEKNTEAGRKALEFVAQLCPPGPCMVKIAAFDKYKRWLGELTGINNLEVNFELLVSGNATPVVMGCEE